MEFYVKGTEPLNICSHDDETNLVNLMQDPSAAREKEKEKKKGFWGWLKKVFK